MRAVIVRPFNPRGEIDFNGVQQELSDPARLTVMALWDGEAGDGPGGTGDFLARGGELGATPSAISTGAICARD